MSVAEASISEAAAAIVEVMEAQLLPLQKQFLGELTHHHHHQFHALYSYFRNSLLANLAKL
jgi:hypothetical protein